MIASIPVREFDDAYERIACRLLITPPAAHAADLQHALQFLKATLFPSIHEHYRQPQFIRHVGGHETLIAALLLQTLSGFLEYPDDYLVLASHVASVHPLPTHAIDHYLRILERRMGRMYTP